MTIRKVKVGDLIRRRWLSNKYHHTQIVLDFKAMKDYGIVMKVDEDNGVVHAYFFDNIHSSPIPLRIGFFDIID